ncbi:DegT/DnrJ/EryC1/StrS family aminotransferase [Pelagicoccus sp. NFK12]|uniref:DegT/DnrJ/EryC1/StrS family aminotransferase n=1 Tax=Pelagicoccus enzymogenes TaxID=2773457 RepID=A0A927FAM4_9BACT|nr:DegT/DnrJ/EryC1/StrS family aminotransferase [Pelagicoccus enzymogenes]MBD5781462.1 DegT/DnrJ/EryC1/StrS family aminotransferase [Pelagicoccus enzymogenes]
MQKPKFPIFVTRPSLPDLNEFHDQLKILWDSKWLTNNGAFHQRFERELAEFLGVKYVSLFSNGTLALITALQSLRITGDVITTPYSFVATTHALNWNGIRPIFCDVDPIYGNICPKSIESLITPKTTAIVPVHVYGNPADNSELQRIADTYGLKLIYDAAHAFNVRENGKSILNYGDLSILSFHATKAFNTIEGGAIICHDSKTKSRLDFLKNFGFADEVTVVAPGINAKMNELQAAYGLLQLKSAESEIEKRSRVHQLYADALKNIKGIRTIPIPSNVEHNFSYFPIFIEPEYALSRDKVYEEFRKRNIIVRRYFYPLISEFPPYRALPSASPDNLPTATNLAQSVLNLPIYPDLSQETVEYICHQLATAFNS